MACPHISDWWVKQPLFLIIPRDFYNQNVYIEFLYRELFWAKQCWCGSQSNGFKSSYYVVDVTERFLKVGLLENICFLKEVSNPNHTTGPWLTMMERHRGIPEGHWCNYILYLPHSIGKNWPRLYSTRLCTTLYTRTRLVTVLGTVHLVLLLPPPVFCQACPLPDTANK